MNRKDRRGLEKDHKEPDGSDQADLAASVHQAIKKAQSLFESGDLKAADNLCRQASALAPLDGGPYHLRALIQYRMGHLEKAGDMIRKAASRTPDDPEIYANCGAIMNMLGRHPEAETASLHLLKLDPMRADGHNNLAIALEMQGRLEEAIKACESALEIKPDFPEAFINLGNLKVRSDEPAGAAESFANAIDLAPSNAMAHANMSVAQLRLEKPEAAEKYARQAVALNPSYADALNALGNALVARRKFDEAVNVFDQALELRPGSIEAAINRAAALHKGGEVGKSIDAYRNIIGEGNAPGEVFAGLGVALLANGDTNAAIDAFRNALIAKPGMGDAYYNLASALGAGVEERELDQMKALLAEDALSAENRILLQFALGEVYDKRGAYDLAFPAFDTGNRLRAAQLEARNITFEPDAFERQINRIIESYPDGFMSDQKTHGKPTQVPVFIVGMPRSGTTLVEQILAAHPQVSTLGEAATFMNIDDANKTERAALEARLSTLFEMNEPSGKVIDKTPFHFLSLGIIAQIYPQAQIIHCQRNADDVAISCFFQNFVGAYPWSTELSHIRRYIRAEQRLMAHWKKASGLRIFDVSYEGLVKNPARISQQLIEFLGLPWDDACLRFDRNKGQALTASNWQVRKPVYTSSVDRARAYEKYLGEGRD